MLKMVLKYWYLGKHYIKTPGNKYAKKKKKFKQLHEKSDPSGTNLMNN